MSDKHNVFFVGKDSSTGGRAISLVLVGTLRSKATAILLMRRRSEQVLRLRSGSMHQFGEVGARACRVALAALVRKCHVVAERLCILESGRVRYLCGLVSESLQRTWASNFIRRRHASTTEAAPFPRKPAVSKKCGGQMGSKWNAEFLAKHTQARKNDGYGMRSFCSRFPVRMGNSGSERHSDCRHLMTKMLLSHLRARVISPNRTTTSLARHSTGLPILASPPRGHGFINQNLPRPVCEQIEPTTQIFFAHLCIRDQNV